MSRATTIGPVSDSRVLTGYRDSVARISFIGRLRSMRTTSPSSRCVVGDLGQVLRRVALELLEEHAVAR